MKSRCPWACQHPLYLKYHDNEWGTPTFDDRKLFEYLVLESFQAGLSWLTILKKRSNFRRAFDGFDPELIARYDQNKVSLLLQDSGIVRNRRKIEAAVANARAFVELQAKHGSFAAYIWSFVDGTPKVNSWKSLVEVPATSPEAQAMVRELKRQGFCFIGSTICYSFMQAAGMVNDHLVDCFRYHELLAGLK